LSELNILLAALIIAFLVQTLQISTKATTVSEQQLFKKWNSKTEVSNMESCLSSWYTITSVTVCAQSGRRLCGHMCVVEHATVKLLGQ